jgi:uncharacterized protein (TIGR00730 family)
VASLGTVCVFCGSSYGNDPVYAETARALGRELARRGIGLVYGGASVGLMGELATAVLEAGGAAVGVIPRALVEREIAYDGLTELHVVETMHERKALMTELASGFAALPGGMGTLDELAEAITWGQLGIHAKPIGLLDVRGYFEPLLAFVDRAVEAGFLRRDQRAALLVAEDAASLLDVLESAARRRQVVPAGEPPPP